MTFPVVNQLHSATLDGKPDENRFMNCVIACIVACILYYHPEYRGKVVPDSVKDAVLGEAYANRGTDAGWFVQFCAAHGVKLTSITGSVQEQIQMAHKALQQDHVLIATEKDPYVDTSLPQYKDWTHAIAWCDEVPGGLKAMDPFGGTFLEKSDAAWQRDLRGNILWIAEAMPHPQEIPIIKIPEGWHDTGSELIAPNHISVVHGFREHILQHRWDAANWPLEEEHGQEPLELSNLALGGGTQQVFRWSVLEWTQTRGVFEAWCGQELLYLRQKAQAQSILLTHDQALIQDVGKQLHEAQAALQQAQASQKIYGALVPFLAEIEAASKQEFTAN